MSSQSIKAGEAWWEITARDKATSVMNAIAERLKRIGKGTALAGGALSAIGTAVVAPIVAAGNAFSNYVDGLNDARVKTGLTVESLSSLAFVAEQQGTSLEGLQAGLRGMAKFTTAVASGSGGAIKVLGALGIAAGEFLAATPEQRFRMLADQLSRIEDPTLRAGVAMKVFGKSATDLLPTIALGSAGIAEMQQRADDLGLVVSQTDADKFGAFGDELAAIGRQVRMAWWQAGAALIETFGWVVPIIQRALATTIAFVKGNRPLVGVLLLAAGAAIAFGTALSVAGGLVWSAGVVMSSAASLVSVAWTVAAGVKAAVVAINAALASTVFAEGGAALFSAAATWVLNVAMGGLAGVLAVVDALLAALLSPLGLVILGIAAISVVAIAATIAFVQLTESGRRASESISAGFASMFAVVGQVFRGIWDALSAGEWGLAATIGFAAVSLAWAVMVAGMSDAWYGFVGFIGWALLGALQFVDGAIRTVLNGLIEAYNFAAAQMGWATVSTLASGSELLAQWQTDLDAWTGEKSKARWAEVDKQRQALNKATTEAADKRKAFEDRLRVDVPKMPGLEAPDLSKLMGAGKGQKAEGPGTLGTFNAAIAGMLNQSLPDHMATVADNTAQTNDLLEELIGKVEEGGLEWGN